MNKINDIIFKEVFVKNFFYLFLFLWLFSGCSSAPKPLKGDVMDPDYVVSRIDSMDERPKWIQESEIFRIENENVILTGKQTIRDGQNLEQAFRAAENNAKSALAKAIEQKVQFIFQNAEEGYSLDANQARYVGMEATEIMRTSAIRPYKRYWEKYRTTVDTGERVTRVDAYSLVQMPESEFKRAVVDAIRARQGKGGISAEFADKVNSQWDQFTKDPEAQKKEKNNEN